MIENDLQKRIRPVAIWVLIGVVMLMIQVVLGGITRLTGSGLSITEWKPILGAVPPTTEQAWLEAFEKYKTIGQYKQINFHFTLSDFKFIYFWEWFHREWARLIAVAFAIPFVIFLFQKRFTKAMITPLLVLFAMGGLQGAIGWIMVASGLNDENIYVSHFKLAIHFISALVLVNFAVWFALRLLVQKPAQILPAAPRKQLFWLLALTVLQLIYGAFMAGLKAALAAPTWPTINGSWFPESITGNMLHDVITIHFIHRGLAYLLVVATLAWWWKNRAATGYKPFDRWKNVPVLLIFAQLALGILTVLNATQPNLLILFGALHQFIGMAFASSIVVSIYLLKPTGLNLK